MNSKIRFILIAITAAVVAGCASVGKNFDESKVAQIKKGETTEAQLVLMFGEPQNRMVNSEGQSILTWMYTQANIRGESFIPIAGAFVGGADTKSKSLNVTLKDGTVQSYSSTGGGMDSRGTTQEVPKK